MTGSQYFKFIKKNHILLIIIYLYIYIYTYNFFYLLQIKNYNNLLIIIFNLCSLNNLISVLDTNFVFFCIVIYNDHNIGYNIANLWNLG